MSATIAARLDRLPVSPTIFKMVTLISLGGFFEFYDIFLTAYIAPGLYKAGFFSPVSSTVFGLDNIATFIAVFFAGLFISTLFLSRIADRFGRKTIFNFSLVWYSICTIAMAFQTSSHGILFYRFAAGIGIGMELVVIDTYLSELVPKTSRGRAFAFNQLLSFSAIPVVALLSLFLVPRSFLGIDGWRWVALIGSTGAFLVFIARRNLPESPRWLERSGRHQEADRIMRQIERQVERETARRLAEPGNTPEPQSPAFEDSLSAVARGRQLDPLKVGLASEAGPHKDVGEGGRTTTRTSTKQPMTFREIWQPPYRRRTIMLAIFNLCQTIGFYGFANWVPTFLISKGITVTKSLEYSLIIAFANPIAPFLGHLFAEKIERKWQIVWSALGIAVFGLCFSQQTSLAGVVTFGVLVTLSANFMSFAFHAYQAELYPTHIRAQGIGFVYSWSRFGGIVGSFVIAAVLKEYGSIGAFSFIAFCMIIVATVISGFGPRTNSLSLEEINRVQV
ncbi:MAG: MFS transporter [Verrucomicrobia bacterium]|nr:MFS transporter [Verrucomicrobiota bacterium]